MLRLTPDDERDAAPRFTRDRYFPQTVICAFGALLCLVATVHQSLRAEAQTAEMTATAQQVKDLSRANAKLMATVNGLGGRMNDEQFDRLMGAIQGVRGDVAAINKRMDRLERTTPQP